MNEALGGLPTWAQMSDLDRGAALLLLWDQRQAVLDPVVGGPPHEPHPGRYLDDPALRALPRSTAVAHAGHVTGGWDHAWSTLGEEEVTRLYRLAHDGPAATRTGP